LDFKNIILEEKLSNKLKNGNEKFLPFKTSKFSDLHGFRISKQEVPKPWKPLQFFFQMIFLTPRRLFRARDQSNL
jgi:hypothetical protein